MIFVCPSVYKSEISPDVLTAHRTWLKQLVEDEVVLSAGRRDPAIGGLIVLRADSVEAARDILAGDPFVSGGVCDYEPIGYTPSFGSLQG